MLLIIYLFAYLFQSCLKSHFWIPNCLSLLIPNFFLILLLIYGYVAKLQHPKIEEKIEMNASRQGNSQSENEKELAVAQRETLQAKYIL